MEGKVSLPDSVDGAPFATEVMPVDQARVLTSFEDHMLQGINDRMQLQTIEPYCDVKLRRSKKAYTKFVCSLWGRGLIKFKKSRKGRIGLFYLWQRRTISCAWYLMPVTSTSPSCLLLEFNFPPQRGLHLLKFLLVKPWKLLRRM